MNRLPSANFFTTKAFFGQKLATSVAEHATSVRKAKTSGNKKKTKTSQKNETAQNDKSEKDKKNSKAKANVTATTTDSNKSVVDTGAKTKTTNSSKTVKHNKNKKVKKNSNKNVSALKGGVKEKSIDNAVISSSVANNESKKVDTKNRSVRDGDGHGHHEQAIKKMGGTLPGVATARIEDHPLDYSPEALLVDHEEVYLHDKEDASHLVGRSNVLETDPHLGGLREQTAEEEVDVLDDLEDATELPFDESTHIPKRYREGTAGGKLFEEQTLAEIDGYLYLGKVGIDLTFRPSGSAGSISEDV